MKAARPCTIEHLEARTFLSVTPAAFMVGQTLVVAGDGRADNQISVDYTDSTKSSVLVKISSTNASGNPTFLINTFPANKIDRVLVRGV